MTRRGWLLFVAMSLIWGVPYLAIRVAVREVSPPTLVFVRTGIAAALLLPVAAHRGQLRPLLRRWPAVVGFTVVELAVPWLLLSDAERRLSSSLSGLLIAAVPIAGAVLAKLTGAKERFGWRRIAGLVVGLGGLLLLLGFAGDGIDPRVLAEMSLVVFGYAAGPLIVTRFLADLPSLGVVAASLGLTAVGYAPAAIAFGPRRIPDPAVLASLAVLAVLCTTVAFLLFFPLIAELGPSRALVITYLNPAVAVIAGVVVLHEPFSAATAAGFVLVLGGSFLATRGVRPPVAGGEEPAVAFLAPGELAGAGPD